MSTTTIYPGATSPQSGRQSNERKSKHSPMMSLVLQNLQKVKILKISGLRVEEDLAVRQTYNFTIELNHFLGQDINVFLDIEMDANYSNAWREYRFSEEDTYIKVAQVIAQDDEGNDYEDREYFIYDSEVEGHNRVDEFQEIESLLFLADIDIEVQNMSHYNETEKSILWNIQ